MGVLQNSIKQFFKPKPKRPMTSGEKQAIDEQIIIIEQITRGE